MRMVMILTHSEMTITPLADLRCGSVSDLKALKNRLGWFDRDVIIFDSGYLTPFNLDPIRHVFSEEEVVMLFGNPAHRKPAYDVDDAVVSAPPSHVDTSVRSDRGVVARF